MKFELFSRPGPALAVALMLMVVSGWLKFIGAVQETTSLLLYAVSFGLLIFAVIIFWPNHNQQNDSN